MATQRRIHGRTYTLSPLHLHRVSPKISVTGSKEHPDWIFGPENLINHLHAFRTASLSRSAGAIPRGKGGPGRAITSHARVHLLPLAARGTPKR